MVDAADSGCVLHGMAAQPNEYKTNQPSEGWKVPKSNIRQGSTQRFDSFPDRIRTDMKKKQRFKTYFGIPIPPFKVEPLGAGSVTIRFVLTGNIISKKNNEQAVAVRRFARQYLKDKAVNGQVSLEDAMKAVRMVHAKIRGNAEYLKFVERCKPVLIQQMQYWSARLQERGLFFPLPKAALSITLYIKDRYRRDTANAQQTIQDVLKDCGVIIDDNDSVINPITAQSARYYEELIHNIAFVSLSFRLDDKTGGQDEVRITHNEKVE